MAVEFNFKEKYNIDDLLEIMQILRAPGGCPWDREQTHESIKKNFIEETYEVIEAINKNDTELLKEELGDCLLQIVFHSEMERESGSFDFDDVADGICKKLIIRHPHVFGDVKVDGSDEVLTNWDAIKRATKRQKTTTDAMLSVPRELPALMRAEKIIQKAEKTDYKTPSIDDLCLRFNEFSENITKESVGDLLFAVVSMARKNKIDPEDALSSSTDKFLNDFKEYENQ